MRKNKLVQFFTCLCVGSLMFIASPQIIKGISSLNITPHISGTPFYSSFESNDPAAATNQFLSYSGVQSSPSASTQYGPTVNEAYNIAEGDYGFTGEKTFKYNCGAAGINVNKSFQAVIYQEITNVQVGTDFVFKYKILPTLGENKSPSNADLSYISSYISVDLLYNDSPTDFNNLQSLAATGATDQYGYGITPKEQGDAKVLYSAQWNSKQIDLKGIVGKYIHSIVLCYDNDNTSYVGEKILGYVDDISIDAQQPIDSSSLTNYVDTRRGTNSSGDFSRGNNIPATAVPNGFNFYTPMTDSQSD